MTTVTFSANVQVAGGPQLGFNRSIEVEAYDRIDVTLEPQGSTAPVAVDVQIQPSLADKVLILALTSTLFDPDIVYQISDGTAAGHSADTPLDQPQVFAGGAIKLLGFAPKIIKLTNKISIPVPPDPTKTARVTIFVGRKATP
jgi:hypothetical protein